MRILFVICTVFFVMSMAIGNMMDDSLMKRVSNFCETEFNGDHGNRIMYFATNIRDNNVVDFVEDAVDIVDSYKILSTNVVGNSATVMVEYNLVAEIRETLYNGWPEGPKDPSYKMSLADKIVKVNNPKHVQKLLWKYHNVDQKWYLVSTQLPKVSRNALLKLLHEDVERQTITLQANPGHSLPHLEASRSWHLKKIDTIEALDKSAVDSMHSN